MGLAEYLERHAVGAGVLADDRDETLRWFACRFEEAGVLPDADAGFEALAERERIASTVLVEGVAVPHARVPGARRLAFGALRCGKPVVFEGVRPAPVELIFAIVGPPEETARHVALLGGIARLVGDPARRRRMLEATRVEELLELLEAEDGTQG